MAVVAVVADIPPPTNKATTVSGKQASSSSPFHDDDDDSGVRCIERVSTTFLCPINAGTRIARSRDEDGWMISSRCQLTDCREARKKRIWILPSAFD